MQSHFINGLCLPDFGTLKVIIEVHKRANQPKLARKIIFLICCFRSFLFSTDPGPVSATPIPYASDALAETSTMNETTLLNNTEEGFALEPAAVTRKCQLQGYNH